MEAIRNLGNTVVGSVFDCDKKWLERRLKQHDHLLYIKWNPKKNAGNGVWEIRRRPEHKTAVWKTGGDGIEYFSLEYVENDMIHHVLDCPYLSESLVDKIKSMDTAQHADWVAHYEYETARSQARLEKQARDELNYQLKSHHKYIKILHEEAIAGRNPAHFFASGWKK